MTTTESIESDLRKLVGKRVAVWVGKSLGHWSGPLKSANGRFSVTIVDLAEHVDREPSCAGVHFAPSNVVEVDVERAYIEVRP